MEKIIMSRGSGKTGVLIGKSSTSKCPILTLTHSQAEYVKYLSEQLGYKNMPDPIILNDSEDKVRGLRFDGILVDDADIILSALIAEKYHVPIKCITMSM